MFSSGSEAPLCSTSLESSFRRNACFFSENHQSADKSVHKPKHPSTKTYEGKKKGEDLNRKAKKEKANEQKRKMER